MYHFDMLYGIIIQTIILCIVVMNGINGYTVWYRLEVAVHNYSYLIIQNNNYNELPTFLMYVILVYMYIVYLSQRRASSYLDGCRIFALLVNLLVLTRPN